MRQTENSSCQRLLGEDVTAAVMAMGREITACFQIF